MKSIIVVADEKLKANGRELVHALSKTGMAKAVLYSPKQYEDNENQISSNQYVIFLGSDNRIAKDFIAMIVPQYRSHGAVWGYDGSKACIYAEKSDDASCDISVELNALIKGCVLAKSKPNRKPGIIESSVKGTAKFLSHVADLKSTAMEKLVGRDTIVGTLIQKDYWADRKICELALKGVDASVEKKEKPKLQLQLAQLSFLKDGIDKFIGSEV